MRNNQKPVIVQRVTHFPDPQMLAMAALAGITVAPQSMWVAVGVNTMEVVAQTPEKDKAVLLRKLAEKGHYTVARVINDWN